MLSPSDQRHASNRGYLGFGCEMGAMLLTARSVGLKTCIRVRAIYRCDAIAKERLKTYIKQLIFNL
jgi:hypothetical protein